MNSWLPKYSMLLLKSLVILLLVQAATTRADEKILHEFPILQYASDFSTQGTSMGTRSHASYCEHAFVYNYELDKLLKFDVSGWMLPPVFFNSGRNFVTHTPIGPEGPLLTTVYGLDGEKIRESVIDHIVLPSPNGTYFYSVPMFMIFPARPVLYDSLFQKVPEFPQDLASGPWHASIFADSIYLLQWGLGITKISLPSCEILDKYSVDLQGGGFPRRFFYNSSGSVCAISNRQDIGLVNTESGYTQILSGVLADTAYISTNGDTCTFVNCRKTTLEARVFVWEDTIYNEVTRVALDLNDFFPEALAARVSGIYSVDQGLLINLTVNKVYPADDWVRAVCLLWAYGSTTSGKEDIQVLEGPAWSAFVDGIEKVFALESNDSCQAVLRVQELQEIREPRERD